MKPIAIALLASVAGLAATTARADTRVHVGINLGVPVYHSAPPAVIVAPAPVRHYAPPTVVYAPPPAPRGYWQNVQVKTWVPERWVVRHNRWGRPERYCEPGYYTYTTNRVWVEDCAPSPRAYHPSHGGYYGYHRR